MGAWFAIVEAVHETRAVVLLIVLTVAALGPNGGSPAATVGNVAAGPTPVAFVAVMVKIYSVPAVNPVTV
jgi:hypothetical protein